MPELLKKQALSRGCLSIRGHQLIWGQRTYVMGIVNITSDSFAGDGIIDPKQAVARAQQQLIEGASILDLGGESTRPGHTTISEDEELKRVLPVLKELRNQSNTIISIDTYKAKVFKEALHAGADILNSIWGLNEVLLKIAVEHNSPIIIMHNKKEPVYENNVVDEVLQYLDKNAALALTAGLKAEQIILDPGIGFGKLPEHNIALLKSLDRLVSLGFPTLLGTSRKSTIGKITKKKVEERIYGTAATVALAASAGIDIVRVHDVKEMLDVVKVSDAIVRNWRPDGWQNE